MGRPLSYGRAWAVASWGRYRGFFVHFSLATLALKTRRGRCRLIPAVTSSICNPHLQRNPDAR